MLVRPRYCVFVVRLLIASRRRLHYAARGASTGALQAAPLNFLLSRRAMFSAQDPTPSGSDPLPRSVSIGGVSQSRENVRESMTRPRIQLWRARSSTRLTVTRRFGPESLLHEPVDRSAASPCNESHCRGNTSLATAARKQAKQTPSKRHTRKRWAATPRPAPGGRPGT